ncbi:hypothetical protein [Arthrobacter sp. MDT1-65]
MSGTIATFLVDDRNSAVTARADGVLANVPAVVAYGLGSQSIAAAAARNFSALGADQLWLVVDAACKPDDMAAWAGAVRKTVPVHALAVVNTTGTMTPATVNELGLPVGFVDGAPAVKAVL